MFLFCNFFYKALSENTLKNTTIAFANINIILPILIIIFFVQMLKYGLHISETKDLKKLKDHKFIFKGLNILSCILLFYIILDLLLLLILENVSIFFTILFLLNIAIMLIFNAKKPMREKSILLILSNSIAPLLLGLCFFIESNLIMIIWLLSFTIGICLAILRKSIYEYKTNKETIVKNDSELTLTINEDVSESLNDE